jgi:arylsulfatase A-like enzyme
VNIVVIVIDTLRYDYVGAHGNDWIRTPHMDALAAESWVFENSYAAAYPTIPHRTDAITGRHGGPFHVWQPLAFDVPALPRALADVGYCTQLIHDTPHLVNGGHNFDWPFHAWTFIRGAEVDRPWLTDSFDWPANWAQDPLFDALDDDAPGRLASNGMVRTYARANCKRQADEDWNCAKLFRTAAQFLADNARRDNFSLWLDCFDPHEPWDAPPELVKLYDRTDGYDGRIDPRSFLCRNHESLPEAAFRRVQAAYAAKVSWVDRWVGEFLDALDRTGLRKNTAVLLTADHGTRDGREGSFGKSYPLREGEGHTPFIVYVPGGGSGRSDILVQPQDIFATVMALAGGRAPRSLDSHDVLAVARDGLDPPRRIAVAGRPTSAWNQPDQPILFSAFDGRWCLEVAAKPQSCRLLRMGELDDVAAEHGEVVERLRREALDEVERRGADPAIMHWLRSEGEAPFPHHVRHYDGWPGRAGYYTYFSRLYRGE